MVSKNRDPDSLEIDAGLLGELARLVGIELGNERASALVAQAVPHFAMLRQLDAITVSNTEPAAEFRLDQWTRTIDE